MDFFQVCTKEAKGGTLEVYPDFIIGRSKDLMVRGKSFYAVWDEANGLWSTDEYDVQRLVDEELHAYVEKNKLVANIKSMRSFGSQSWVQFRKFMSQVSDNSHQLDDNLTFANTKTKKTDYVSRRLPYAIAAGEHKAYDELIEKLYDPEQKAKIEWAIGAVISGDSKTIHKFLILFGPPGYGKGTVLDLIEKMFEGYITTFDAKSLVGNNNAFATEVFKGNPLVAIQADGDLSKVEDNSKLNSIVAHDSILINEKYKPGYNSKVRAFLFMGTNSPVKITDAKSGLIRRLIDAHPTGNLHSPNKYHELVARMDFEIGAIAHHCLEVYRSMGKNYYSSYRPLDMMFQTDVFFNFIEAHFDIFKSQPCTTLKQAYALYKEFCEDTGIDRRLPQYKVRGELSSYFEEFKDRHTIDGTTHRSCYSGFTAQPFKAPVDDEAKVFSLVIDEVTSIFDLEYAECAAQEAKEDGTPRTYWSDVKTTLAEVDTSQVHYVKVPENHIVIDFDLKDDNGEKSLERNLEAASEWPATYAELSKSGAGVHLHYIFDGEVSQLAREYSEGIEVKVYSGNGSLRRRLSQCNNVPVAHLNSGLPLKEKKQVLGTQTIQSEKGLRDLVARNLRKEIHPGTKPSVDFIHKILEEAYLSGMTYDLTDLRPKIIAFANNSSNQPLLALKVVQKMRFKSEEVSEAIEKKVEDERLVFFDCEVYVNLLVICWKYEGSDTVVRMINPSPQEVEGLFQYRLVGFHNRRYDNHILYARYMGYDNESLYKLSQSIIGGSTAAMFTQAYNLSWADVLDYSSVKQGLKKFQIDLGIPHKEMDIPWDQPVPEDRINDVVEYCCNDVRSTEAVHNARKQDYVARQILAELSGLTINDTTQKHTARIIFGNDRNPQRSFIYTDLSKEFPEYKFDKFGKVWVDEENGVKSKSWYRDEDPGEGGYVYAEPGMYSDVALLDVESMHPTTIMQLGLFGEYTDKFWDLVMARLAIKHGDYGDARHMLDGKLAPYLKDEKDATALSNALKIVINIVYGLTSAQFDNPFRDIRNIDNIVAKRGALFMIDLKHFLQERGFTVAHIKTDSVKIPNATPEIIEEVVDFGRRYGYNFDHEATFDRFCLVNDAVFVARKVCWSVQGEPTCLCEREFDHNAEDVLEQIVCTKAPWKAVGAQFQHPYVFKSLFRIDDEITFNDLCETKHVVQGTMYLDFSTMERDAGYLDGLHFVGRTGRFVPVKEGYGGGILYRVKDEKTYAVTGTKGYLWVEADIAEGLGAEAIDMRYFDRLLDEARNTIQKFGDVEAFVS